jgi:tripartite-type tricarboxylate transporter receptor subunit TctC
LFKKSMGPSFAKRFHRVVFLVLVSTILGFYLVGRATTAVRYPDHAITVVVGFAAGGESDRVARLLADKLSLYLRQPVVVLDRPGAGGSIATMDVARAPRDGYTLLMGSMGPLAVAQSLPDPIDRDVDRQLVPVSMTARFDQVLVVHPSLPVHTLADFVAFAKAHPGQVSYASTGIGSASHLAAKLFQRVAHIELVHVPYQGGSRIVPDLLAGDVVASFAPATAIRPYVDAGQLRALARTGLSRANDWPALPTFAESGFPRYDVNDWYAVMAPSGTPADIIHRLNEEVVQALDSPKIKQTFARLGLQATPTSESAAGAFIDAERLRWSQLLRDTSSTR